MLKRAIRTLWLILDTTDRMWIPVERSWRLNERHYGALQGLDKAQTVEKHGEAQVKIWRRSYDIPPPPLAPDDPRNPRFDPRYAEVDPYLPAAESLKDTLARVLPYWESRIVPELRAGKNVLIVAHGNSLRALVKMLDMMSEADIVEFNIPTGIPILYELDEQLQPVSRRFLGDPGHRRGPGGGQTPGGEEIKRALAITESGAMATLMPDNASVKSTWQDKREIGSRKSGSSRSSSSSSLCGFGRRAAQFSSTYT